MVNAPEHNIRPDGQDALYPNRLIALVSQVLCALWLTVPALQYFATSQRTFLQIDGNTAFPALATLDLTPVYFLMVALTAALFIYRTGTLRKVAESL